MDNFTLAVLVGAVIVLVVFGVLMLMDKKKPAPPAEPLKPTGKRSA